MAKVLIADDHAEVRQVLDLTLRRCGWHVSWAADGAEACRLATADPPDLALLDVAMPGLDGVEVCRRLRAYPPTADIPIVMVTASYRPDVQESALEAGATAFIRKPFSPTELIQVVHGLLEGNGCDAGGNESVAGH